MKEFECVSTVQGNEKWENAIKREVPLYQRTNDIRSPFERDYTRIIHSTAYRRLKHKTQVFFSPENDHICTRSEHVTHVESISYTIAHYLGLNTELTRAIATAHDIGHSPFGHQGERILSKISERDVGERFWHERNGMVMVDKIELLENPDGDRFNLDLSYGVRDGIISHCGEIDENMLRPRDEFIDLYDYSFPNEFAPYTWEGCVVKISDKISYLGRDIIDAVTLGILDERLEDLHGLLNVEGKINNTVIINDFIYDLCANSSVEKGLCFSDKMFDRLNEIKRFNYEYIYLSDKLKVSMSYFELILNTIYDFLKSLHSDRDRAMRICSELVLDFEDWISNYWCAERGSENKNAVIFDTEDPKDWCRAIICYISGMTDNYAIETFNRIIRF